ncbi:MAG: DHH family phosphoesterase, partial [Clostridia bacterium]|nr:DHH family phosphoesterase [Clostridia bacterium]
MSATVSEQGAARLLRGADHLLIVSHAAPDGDTVGAAFALGRAMQILGKSVRIECSDAIPHRYDYLFSGVKPQQFEPQAVVAVDIADRHLIGERLSAQCKQVLLCIDHHVSNMKYADHTLVDAHAAATCEIVARVIQALGVAFDREIASAVYTGLASDTGCFRYSNTTPATLRCAAAMSEYGADTARINKILFETVSLARLRIESGALASLELLYDGRIAMMTVPLELMKSADACEEELEGIASLPAQIEGVQAGITVKEKQPGFYKISMRTDGSVNASRVCA